MASNKWNFKAEWVDPTLLRNAVSYTLWESMVDARESIPKYEVDNAWWPEHGALGEDGNFNEQTGARGFPYAFPMQISMDEKFYGLGMLMTGHEPKNFNMDKTNSNHMYLEFEGNFGTTDKSWSGFSEDNFARTILRVPSIRGTEHEKALIRLGNFFNKNNDDFKSEFEEHLDKINIIDMLLFMEAIYDWDSIHRDNEFVTYDLKKWYILPWDKDGTFGSTSDVPGVGESLEGASDYALDKLFNYEDFKEDELLWVKTYHAFKEDVETRYASLRKQSVFSAENIFNIAKRFNTVIPRDVREAEYEKWKDELGGERAWGYELTSTTQLVDWFERRLVMLDKHFGYEPEP